jgi:hypothetical protein
VEVGSPSQHVSALYELIFLFVILPIYFLIFLAQFMHLSRNNDRKKDGFKRVLIPNIGCTISIAMTTLVLLCIQANYFYAIFVFKNIFIGIWAFIVWIMGSVLFYGLIFPVMISDNSDNYGTFIQHEDKHEGKSCSIIIGHIILNIVVILLNITTSTYFFLQLVISCPAVFFVLSNAYWVNIVANVTAKQTFIISPFCMIINSAFIFYYPISIYGISRWNEVYTANWLGFLFLLN